MRSKEKVRQRGKGAKGQRRCDESPPTFVPLCLCAFSSLFPFSFFLAGCSHSDVPLAEVTGEITFNGSPARAEIVFEPQSSDGRTGGRPSSAFAESDGSFRLSYTADRTGAVIGRHHVLLKILRPAGDDEPHSFEEAVTPIKTTRLVRHVREGKNHFHFAVTY